MNRKTLGRQIGLVLLGAVIGLIAVGFWRWSSLARDTCPVQLRDITEETGIRFMHTDGSAGKRYIVEYISAGFATFDYDNDGLVDIYFVNGAPLQGTEGAPVARNALYRNLGNFRFEDCTEQAGVGDTGYGVGATVGDYDNDGDQDLYVSNFGPKVLYRNNGDGTFTDVTRQAGVADGNKVGAGASFLDMDADGDLDLYVANYVDFRYETYRPSLIDGIHVYPGPMEFDPVDDTLYRNNGDGTFTDVSEASGIHDVSGTGMGMVCGDYDNDGDTDVFVLNDVAQNFLFVNDGAGHFQEMAILAGVAFNGEGHTLGSMGVDCGDYDNDGWLDFFQTSYSDEMPALFHNLQGRGFEDVTIVARAGTNTLPDVNWGVGFADFDNDGDQDLFLANGHLQDNLEAYDTSLRYESPNTLLLNQGDGSFLDVSDVCGDGLAPKHSSRGASLDDFDNDGRVDIVTLNSRTGPTVIRNVTDNTSHWLQIRLHGVTSNRDGVGTQVRLTTADGTTQLQEVHSGRSYQGHFGTRLHFGLGQHARAQRIEVRWLGGGTDEFVDVAADRMITITEGESEPR